MISGQTQGSVIAQVVIDPVADAYLSAYAVGPLGIITPKTEYVFSLESELSASPSDGSQVLVSIRTAGGNPFRQVRQYTGLFDVVGVQRVQIVDAAGAAATANAGDRVFVSILRSSVPTL